MLLLAHHVSSGPKVLCGYSKGEGRVGRQSKGADVAHHARMRVPRAGLGIRGGLFCDVLRCGGSLRRSRGSSTIPVTVQLHRTSR
jgi:hypothetical protein